MHTKTDAERRQLLADVFELDGNEHPNVAQFYRQHLAVLDAERMAHLVTLVEGAKARYAERTRKPRASKVAR